jgi:hypothetical protein
MNKKTIKEMIVDGVKNLVKTKWGVYNGLGEFTKEFEDESEAVEYAQKYRFTVKKV